MMQIMLKGHIYHCKHCHKSYRYRGEVTGCFGADCCHGSDQILTPDEVWKEAKKKPWYMKPKLMKSLSKKTKE